MEKILRILSGFNQCAEVPVPPGISLVVGRHSDCAVILADSGIAERHCRIVLEQKNQNAASEVLCTAIDANIQVSGRTLQPGETMRVPDYAVIQCGSIFFALGDRSCNWQQLEESLEEKPSSIQGVIRYRWRQLIQRVHMMPTRQRRAYGAVLVSGALVMVAFILAALPARLDVNSQAYLDEAKRWLKSVAPPGSELTITRMQDGQLLLSGYIATSYQNETLTLEAKNSQYQPRLEVYAVEQMVASLSRLTNLGNLPCIANYLSAGRLGCNNDIPDKRQATHLQTLAQQIPGVKALELRSPVESVVAESDNKKKPGFDVANAMDTKPEVPKQAAAPGFPEFKRKLGVFISKQESYVVDARGFKFREGDVIDGYTITSINLDQIQLAYGDQRFALQIAMMQ